MALRADRRDYKRAFYKHFSTINSWPEQANLMSRELILVYCVESGLKYQLMKKYGLITLEDAIDDIQELFRTHDFQQLLSKLCLGEYHFKSFRTNHNESVGPKTYHQFYRYGIMPKDEKEKTAADQYVVQLESIADWIKEQG